MKTYLLLIAIIILFSFVACTEETCDCPTGNTEIIITDTNDLWQRINGPYGDKGLLPDIYQNDDGNILLISNNHLDDPSFYNYLYVSEDNGDSWDKIIVSDFIPSFSYGMITKGDMILLGARPISQDSLFLKKSTDQGDNWGISYLNYSPQFDVSYATCLGKDSQGGIYISLIDAAYQKSAILRSSNNGVNWVEIISDSYNSLKICKHGEILFYGSKISSDYGSTWTEIEVINNEWIAILQYTSEKEIFYNSFNGGVYRFMKTNDMFLTSTECSNGLFCQSFMFGGGVHELTESKNGNLYCRTDLGMFRSINNGENWEMILDKKKVFDFIFTEDGYLILSQGRHNISGGFPYSFYRTKVPIE